jgi:hypothetical protein
MPQGGRDGESTVNALRKRTGNVTATVVCFLCLALPGCATAAKPASREPISGRFRSWLYPNSAEVLLRGTNGYRLTIFAGSVPAKKLDVYATKGEEQVHYEVPATVTRTSIKASLGALGSIDGTFRASKTVRPIRVSTDCTTNRPPVVRARLAAFVGTISFRGEEDFTEASAAPDAAPPRPKAECEALRRDAALSGSQSQEVSLLAGRTMSGGQLIFTASQAPIFQLWPQPPSPATPDGSFGAVVNTRDGRVGIERSVQVAARPGDFSFDSAFTSAHVAPPRPFSGSADFERGSGGAPGWSGDLSVEIPGLGPVELTGSGIEAALGKGGELVTEEKVKE